LPLGDQFYWRKNPEFPERTTDHGQATGKLYHLLLRVECTLCCNLQSRALTHTVFPPPPNQMVVPLVHIALNANITCGATPNWFRGPGWLNGIGSWMIKRSM
jgi:hypothetical protein